MYQSAAQASFVKTILTTLTIASTDPSSSESCPGDEASVPGPGNKFRARPKHGRVRRVETGDP